MTLLHVVVPYVFGFITPIVLLLAFAEDEPTTKERELQAQIDALRAAQRINERAWQTRQTMLDTAWRHRHDA